MTHTVKKILAAALVVLLALAIFFACVGADGLARWSFALFIITAVETVRDWERDNPGQVRVVFEDARQRRWIPDTHDLRREMGRRQGAGSVKRDATIWQDALTDYGIPFEAVKPRQGLTKWDAPTFARFTGWEGRTSEHARDAALLVFGR